MPASGIAAVCRREAKDALIAAAVGVVISALFAVGMPAGQRRFGVIVFHGALTGFAIYAAISLLLIIFGRMIGRIAGERSRTAAHILTYAVGGIIGWLIGMGIAVGRFSNILDARWLWFMGLTVAIVIAVGLVLRSFDTLQTRLRDREWAEKELQIARSIQERLLPPNEFLGNGYALAARNLPALIVAGDFYDFVRLDDGSVAIVVADVAGKGVGASLIMASVKAVMPFVAQNDVTTAMSQLNDKLLRELAPREFVALTLARFFPADGRLEIANAGLPDPYLIGSEGVRPLVVSGERLPLGMRAAARYESITTHVDHGERVLFITDGIPEAETANGDPLGYERLNEFISGREERPATAWLDELISDLRSMVRSSLSDDWTAVVLQRE